MWKRKHKTEWLPWYRARNYKGDLTEAEKRQLDAFRAQPKHPAADLKDLPQEVQDYIGQIEIELYDKKQEGAAATAFALSAIGAALIYLNFNGCLGTPTIWSYAAAVLLIVVAWIWYGREWRKNAEEFRPSDGPWPTEEAIRQQWELNWVDNHRRAKRDVSNAR